MRNLFKAVFMLGVGWFFTTATHAQARFPAETQNAALRYWMAFVALQDTGADESTKELLEKTLAGQTMWDEARLGPLVNDNLESIGIMQRASKLPECDWGYEYTVDDPAPPVHFIANSARALARLNALYGMRLAARGDTEHAAEVWLSGIRFSQHLAEGGSLFLTLTAASTLQVNLKALTQAAHAGSLSPAEREQAESVVRALPESDFDWGGAWEIEGMLLDKAWAQLGSNEVGAKDPLILYQDLTGLDPAALLTEQNKRHATMKTPPSAKGAILYPPQEEFDAFRNFMGQVATALRLSPATARGRLNALKASERALSPLLTHAIPGFERVNEVRLELATTRRSALQALGTR